MPSRPHFAHDWRTRAEVHKAQQARVLVLLREPVTGDPGVLRAAAKYNAAHVGIYAEVVCGWVIRENDIMAVCG